MAVVLDAVLGKVLEELLNSVVEMKDRALKFKPTLERLEKSLQSLSPLINQIYEFNKKLGRPAKETERLIKQLKDGKELVLKCSDEDKIKWWNCYKMAQFQEELETLDDEITRFFELELRAQEIRNGLQALLEIRELRAEVRSGFEHKKQNDSAFERNESIELMDVCLPPQSPGFIAGLDGPSNELNRVCSPSQLRVENLEIKESHAEFRSANVGRSERVELRGVCFPPQPPGFIVGLDGPLNELKMRLLKDEVSVTVVTITGSAGSGKSTLAKRFCWDEEVKGKFQENIFFITFAKTPKLNTIVQKLYQHTGHQVPEFSLETKSQVPKFQLFKKTKKVPEFQSYEHAFNQLEHLMKQIGEKSPTLLVLDDVWLGSESLVDKFVFEIPNYKILVTSRFSIRRFGHPIVLKPLSEEHAIILFKHSASLTKGSSDIPDHVVKKIVRGCSGSPLALRVSGRSLVNESQVVWLNRAKELSGGSSILDSVSGVLDPKSMECLRNLGLFPDNVVKENMHQQFEDLKNAAEQARFQSFQEDILSRIDDMKAANEAYFQRIDNRLVSYFQNLPNPYPGQSFDPTDPSARKD